MNEQQQDYLIGRLVKKYFVLDALDSFHAQGHAPTLREVVEETQRRARKVGYSFTNIDITHILDELETPEQCSLQNQRRPYATVDNGLYFITEGGKEELPTIHYQMSQFLASRTALARTLRKHRHHYSYGK